MKRVLQALLIGLLLAGCAPRAVEPGVTATTEPITLDRLISEEQGPRSEVRFLVSKDYPQKVFLTGARLTLLDDKGPLKPERVSQILAGASLQLQNPERHQELMRTRQPAEPNLFVFGPDTPQLQLPQGWGLAMQSNEQLVLTVQWMNRDLYLPPTSVRAQIEVSLSAQPGMRGLRPVPVYAMRLVKGARGYWGIDKPDPRIHGEECMRSQPFPSETLMRDALGQEFQARWYTPHGEQQSATLVTAQLGLPVQLQAVHPYYRSGLSSLELVDLTDKRKLYQWKPAQQTFSPSLVPDGHQVQLRCTYSNPDPVARVALAMLMLYVEAW